MAGSDDGSHRPDPWQPLARRAFQAVEHFIQNLNRLALLPPLPHRYNKNSYKFSGLANLNNSVGVSEVDGAVAITTSSKKKAGKTNATIVKKNARRTAYAAGAVAASLRPDLKVRETPLLNIN